MRVSFGGHPLDVATRQLLQGKTEVRLSPKAFDLLCVLIDNRTRPLSKAELHDQLWPGTYVTDAALSVLVAELRHALHDRPGERRRDESASLRAIDRVRTSSARVARCDRARAARRARRKKPVAARISEWQR
jgi:DNA-binding response OmpR family regulator